MSLFEGFVPELYETRPHQKWIEIEIEKREVC